MRFGPIQDEVGTELIAHIISKIDNEKKNKTGRGVSGKQLIGTV